MDLCTSSREETSLMGVTTLLFQREKIKKEKSLMSLKEIRFNGIQYWDIMERRVFEHYNVKLWLKVCQIANWISISMSIVYMVSKVD